MIVNYISALLISTAWITAATPTSSIAVKKTVSPESLRQAKSQEMLSYLDDSVDPCADFYQFSCGNYVADRQSSISTMPNVNSLFSKYRVRLKTELETNDAAADSTADRQVKLFYQSCLKINSNRSACIDKRKEIIKQFTKMPALMGDQWQKNSFDWVKTVAEISHRTGVSVILGIGAITDFRNNSITRVGIFEQKFDYPSVNLYADESYADFRQIYIWDVTSTLAAIFGVEESLAAITAEEIVDFEIALAQGKVNKHLGLQHSEIFNLTTIEDLQKRYSPDLDAKLLLATALEFVPSELYVDHHYLEMTLQTIRNTSKHVLANYIYYNYIDTLLLIDIQDPREIAEYCVHVTQMRFYKELDNMFYRKYIREEMKPDLNFLWQELKSSFQRDLQSPRLQWMAEQTRNYALHKLEAMKFDILSFEDRKFEEEYSQLQLNDHNYIENILELQLLDAKRSRQALHEPPQPDDDDGYEASIVPSYSPIENLLKIPVSLVYEYHQYSRAYPKALNFASMGSFIGHEMLHGFDDGGRKYDAKGNTRNWWRPHCISEFQKRTDCFVRQYHNYTLEDGQHLPLMKFQSENIADNGGVRAAHAAYLKWYESEKEKNPLVEFSELMPGLNYTKNQLFFLNYGQTWCTTYKASYAALKNNVHVPAQFRVIGPLSNFEEFSKAFQCPKGRGMNPLEKCEIY